MTEAKRNLHLDLRIVESYAQEKEKFQQLSSPTSEQRRRFDEHTQAYLRESLLSWPQAIRRALHAEATLEEVRRQLHARERELARALGRAREG